MIGSDTREWIPRWEREVREAGWGEGEKPGGRAFLTLTAAGEAGTPVLRFDARDARSDVKALGHALHSATSGLLTAVFFSNFCCGYR